VRIRSVRIGSKARFLHCAIAHLVLRGLYHHTALGEQHKALDYYNQALLLERAVGDRGGPARTLSNIGVV